MLLNFDSPYKDHASQTLNWLPMDTEDLYQHNLQNRYKDLEENKWINTEIQYRFNSQGFRCREFAESENIMFVGCSLTVGIGICEYSRWTDLVADQLKLVCYNLGIGGSSSDCAFRLTLGYIDKLKPKILIFRRPPGIRLESVTKSTTENILLRNTKDLDKPNKLLEDWIMDDNNSDLNYLKNMLAIRQLCESRKIKFLCTDPFPIRVVDLARDLAHPGIESNKLFADYIFKMF